MKETRPLSSKATISPSTMLAGGRRSQVRGDMRELRCEEVSSPGPERHRGEISPSETAVSVELDLVEPFVTLRKFINQPRIHGLDEPYLCHGQGVEVEFHRCSDNAGVN